MDLEFLKNFHRRRVKVLAESGPDLIAFETVPNKLEAQDGVNVVSGDSLPECVAVAESSNKIVAVGINCTPPRFINDLILSIKKQNTGVSDKDFVSYVNNWCEVEHLLKPDAVLHLLRKYGFANADISRLVTRWPGVLVSRPNKNLLPKLEFFRSIGVPIAVLVQRISTEPLVLRRSLKDSLIPFYNDLKRLLQSDKRVVQVFSRAPRVFGMCWSEGISSNISILRERGVPESSIVSLVLYQPVLLVIGKEKLAVYVDRAVEMGFDMSKGVFIHAIRVFVDLTESTLKHKMEVYRRCGLSVSDVISAFLRHPHCMSLSEKKIMANMDFLVNKLGCEPATIAQCPVILGLSLEKRIKPRCLVARILNEKGLLNKTTSGMSTLLKMSEEKFLKRYIIKYQEDVPELLEIYHGKLNLLEIDSII
ncbi:hypothetical protein DH2020_024907 [Rehmannia glutinosa]|uniref:Hcy-binding domain-containing protein n=1 Tax=Rehmannia glutinosa TaxID=99300 RepID=A0ABR0W527_REHGL